jgi:hypothetical protein
MNPGELGTRVIEVEFLRSLMKNEADLERVENNELLAVASQFENMSLLEHRTIGVRHKKG